jgi:hypothetical protein
LENAAWLEQSFSFKEFDYVSPCRVSAVSSFLLVLVAKVNVQSLKIGSDVGFTVIDQNAAFVEILVMGENQPLV